MTFGWVVRLVVVLKAAGSVFVSSRVFRSALLVLRLAVGEGLTFGLRFWICLDWMLLMYCVLRLNTDPGLSAYLEAP